MIIDYISKKFLDENGRYDVKCTVKKISYKDGVYVVGLMVFNYNAKITKEITDWIMKNVSWIHALEAPPRGNNVKEVVFAPFIMKDEDAGAISDMMILG